MKANLRRAVVLLLPLSLLLVGSCAERRVVPAPVPSPAPAPPLPLPPPAPAADWRQAPVTPGDWQWTMEAGRSVARFAGGELALKCDRTAGTVTLLRAGRASGQAPVTIETSSLSRTLSGAAMPGPPATVAVVFGTRDPLLDAMAFSRGRFAVEVSGLPTLIVPSWPEVSRVIEDCR